MKIVRFTIDGTTRVGAMEAPTASSSFPAFATRRI